MTFAQPLFFAAFALLPLLLLFMWWTEQERKAALARLGHITLIKQLAATVNWNGRRWRHVLWLLAVILLIIALIRPQWGSEVQVVEQEGLQVMVALDVSHSMLAEDLKPNRLIRAKQEISDLMMRLNGDEIGLVLFSGASFIQFPLTSDYDTARSFLEHAEPGVISRPGTVIGEAIQTAMSGFDEKRKSQKVIVIMTDGEDHETNPLTVAEEVAKEGAIIYTIGFGSTQGAPIPEFVEGSLVGYKEDQQGNLILSKLDDTTLRQISQITDGRYFSAQADGSELDQLVSHLQRLQTERLESRFQTTKIERFQWFLALAILMLFLREVIAERVSTTPTAQQVPAEFTVTAGSANKN